MKTQPNPTDAITALDQSDKGPASEADRLASFHNARLRRVFDYLSSSLEKDDPLEANLGSINSSLILMALELGKFIDQAMVSGSPNVERLTQISPAIDTYLRVTRQVDRFANIELRAAEARKPKPAGDNDPKRSLDTPSNPGIGQSEDSEM